MQTWIALLRGVNVGGRNALPMGELRDLVAGLGAEDVTTYIQSGNVVFRSPETDGGRLGTQIRRAVRETYSFDPEALLLTLEQLEDAVAKNPFPEAAAEPKSLHLYFLAAKPDDPDLVGLEAVASERETCDLIGMVLYLHAPDGIGRSKLAGRAEKLLGVPTTERNWRTVCKIMELARS